jgi:hypothetical protein
MVPHLHRTDEVEQRRVWVGYAPGPREQGARSSTLIVTGVF